MRSINICSSCKYYWKSINAQPLAGMSYPSRITIKQQEPRETQFSPVVTDISINDAWCAGLNKIN